MPQAFKFPSSGLLTFNSEGNSNPDSDYYSNSIHLSQDGFGLTLGRGYFLKSKSPEQIHSELKKINVDSQLVNELIKISNTTETVQRDFLQNYKGKTLFTDEQVQILFDMMIGKYTQNLNNITNKYGLQYDKLPKYQQDVLLDLIHTEQLNETTENKIITSIKEGTFNKLMNNDKYWKKNGTSSDRLKMRKLYTMDKSLSDLSTDVSDNEDEIQPVGGISLNIINLDSWVNLPLNGARLDISHNAVHFILDGKKSPMSINLSQQGINIEDLIVPLKIYYDPEIKCKSISFSLDPFEPTNPEGDFMRKVFYPDELEKRSILESTKFGEVMFEADFVLKQLALGIAPKNLTDFPINIKDFEYPQELITLGVVPTHKIKTGSSGQQTWNRMWIVIKDINTFNQKDKDNSQYFFINSIKMGIEARQMVVNSKGLLEDMVTQDAQSPDKIFADRLTQLYDVASKYFPSFQKLKQMSKAVALAKWLHQNKVPVDLNIINRLFDSQKLKVPTCIKVPSLKKNEETHWEEVKKIPIDLQKLAENSLTQHNLPLTEANITKAIEAIKKDNPGELVNKEITKFSRTLYIFGGVCLDVKEKFDSIQSIDKTSTTTTSSSSNKFNNVKKFSSTSGKNEVKTGLQKNGEADMIKEICEEVNIGALKKMKKVGFPFLKQEICTKCKNYLTLLEASYPTDGKYFCRIHHPYSCTFCCNIIDSGKYIKIQDDIYHPNCVICIHCDQPINNGSTSSVEDGFIHPECFKNYSRPPNQVYAKVKFKA